MGSLYLCRLSPDHCCIHRSFGILRGGSDATQKAGPEVQPPDPALLLIVSRHDLPASNARIYRTYWGKAISGSSRSGCQRFSHSNVYQPS